MSKLIFIQICETLYHLSVGKVPLTMLNYYFERTRYYSCIVTNYYMFVRTVTNQYLNNVFLQVELWKKYITWERSNPLRSEDTALVARRVMFAIEQCLLCLAHHPDVWHQAAQFLDHSAKLLQEKGVCIISMVKHLHTYIDMYVYMHFVMRAHTRVLKHTHIHH